MLKAIGKFIDTTPLQNLISQEEARADSVIIELDRRYGTHDLSKFLFVMRGITESGGEVEVCPVMTSDTENIWLIWEITPAFTKEAGKLALDLFAYRYEEGADPEQDAPDYLVRFQLPPVEVRGLPDSKHVLDEKSYTSFLMKVRNTAEAFLQEITDHASSIWEKITELRSDVDLTNSSIALCNSKTQSLEQRQTALEQDIVPIQILTQEAYDALEPDEDTLYVIKGGSA